MKEDIKQLWECCFTDSQEFIDLYFRLRYKEEINIAILEDGHPISALQMIPYPMTFFDRIWKTAYVSGACTHPQHRAKGAMKELLNRSYQQMYQEGMALTTLIPAEPWLFDYYHTMGYSPVFAYSKQAIDTSTFQASANININKEKLLSTELYDYFNTKQHERNIYLLHTAEDLNVILSDLALANSGIYVARCAGEITGLAIAYQRETTIEINELMANDDITRKSLYKTIQNDYPQQPLIQLERSTSDGDRKSVV